MALRERVVLAIKSEAVGTVVGVSGMMLGSHQRTTQRNILAGSLQITHKNYPQKKEPAAAHLLGRGLCPHGIG
jgi:hypothetical protein